MSDMSVPRIKDEDHYKCRKVKRQRDALLAAGKAVLLAEDTLDREGFVSSEELDSAHEQLRAAIAAVEGEK